MRFAALQAVAAKYDFEVVDQAAAKGRAGRPIRKIEPGNVFHYSTLIANEVMVVVQVSVVTGRLALRACFPDQPGLRQRAEVVVNRSARGAGIVAVHGGEDLVGRGVHIVFGEIRQHRIALRRRP